MVENHQVVMSKGGEEVQAGLFKAAPVIFRLAWGKRSRLGYVTRLTTLRELKLKRETEGKNWQQRQKRPVNKVWGTWAFKGTTLSLRYRLTVAGWRKANK